MRSLLSSSKLVKLFFLVFLIVGLLIFKNYGLSWDEPTQREIGKMNARYAFKHQSWLLDYKDKYYAPVFEVFLVGIEEIFLPHQSLANIYWTRHLINFLLFYLGVIFFYLLAQQRFKNWKISLTGVLFLVLSPRIFAHSFYNSKDIPFLSLFIISIFTLIKYLDKKTISSAVVHALSCALLITVRILGIFLPALTLLFFLADLILLSKPQKRQSAFSSLIIYFLALGILIFVFWPILWQHPLANFWQAFEQMSHYSWWGDILYRGQYLQANQLPWHYLLTWISITTPVIYLFLFLSAVLVLFSRLVKAPHQFYRRHRQDLIFLSWFLIPLISVIVIKSVLYDGWRQMFFIYPALILMALFGLKTLFSQRSTSLFLSIFLIVNLAAVVKFMVQAHPYQHLYFNFLANPSDFQLDYWGLSYRQGLEYLSQFDSSPQIKLYVANQPGKDNLIFLSDFDQQRFFYQDSPQTADYFLTNYRNRRDELAYYQQEIYSVKVGQTKILGIYQLTPE